jgi:hypothetical protein
MVLGVLAEVGHLDTVQNGVLGDECEGLLRIPWTFSNTQPNNMRCLERLLRSLAVPAVF